MIVVLSVHTDTHIFGNCSQGGNLFCGRTAQHRRPCPVRKWCENSRRSLSPYAHEVNYHFMQRSSFTCKMCLHHLLRPSPSCLVPPRLICNQIIIVIIISAATISFLLTDLAFGCNKNPRAMIITLCIVVTAPI